jgi:Sap, sulfolipid-1-addressing protein
LQEQPSRVGWSREISQTKSSGSLLRIASTAAPPASRLSKVGLDFPCLSKVYIFALTAALNPTLLTATTVMLILPKPKRLLLGYWLGAMTTGLVLGVVIVNWLKNSGVVSTSKHTVSPGIDIALGVLALVVAVVVGTGELAKRQAKRREKRASRPKKVPKWQQTLSRGSIRSTFLIGVLLSFPGGSYLASLTEISKHHLSQVEIVLTVISVNLIMLVLLEVPLIGYVVAPRWTTAAIESTKDWLAQNGARTATIGLTVIGIALIGRGVIYATG